MLSLLTGGMLATFAAIAISDFEKDKITYVLDSNLSQARSLALQIRTEFSFALEKIKFLSRGFDAEKGQFHPYNANIFPGEPNLLVLASFKVTESSAVQLTHVLSKPSVGANTLEIFEAVSKSLADESIKNEVAFSRPFGDNQWLIVLRVQSAISSSPILLSALINNSEFLRIFDSIQSQDNFLATNTGKIIIKPKSATYKIPDATVDQAVKSILGRTEHPEGVFQYDDPMQTDTLLMALADPGIGGLKLVTLVPRTAALEAVKKLILKSVLFLGLLFSFTLILAVLSSTTITASLKKLLIATADIAKGNFNVTVKADSTDEIGTLAKGFNTMTTEIRRLVQETAQKARMEGELQTARLVQSTLFPKEHWKDQNLEICGFYEPASECSGDWWYYEKIGNQTMFCIGDATGHGVPAALLTAAARSAASALEQFPDLPIEQMMAVFNRSVFNTARGQVLMTLFLGLYDHDTHQLRYCNASHEPPYVIPLKSDVKKKDLVLLNEVVGPRLGESSKATYEVATYDMNPGDRIVLYTDGVTDLKNKGGEMWGERSLIKLLLTASKNGMGVTQTVAQIHGELSDFRKEHPLHDDVTYFIVTRNAAS
jgi:phosphoserine phosphatase RsbU/P